MDLLNINLIECKFTVFPFLLLEEIKKFNQLHFYKSSSQFNFLTGMSQVKVNGTVYVYT